MFYNEGLRFDILQQDEGESRVRRGRRSRRKIGQIVLIKRKKNFLMFFFFSNIFFFLESMKLPEASPQ